MPTKRSDYTFLTQIPNVNNKFSGGTSGGGCESSHRSNSGEKKKNNERGGFDRGLMNLIIDQRMQQNRQSSIPAPIGGLQRQSSWSSYTESSLSGDYFNPSSFAATSSGCGDDGAHVHLSDGGDGQPLRLELTEAGDGGGWSSSLKSWAQQTEEGYKLQLALALRLTSEATCTDDPNLLDPVVDGTATSRSSMASASSAEDLSRRFWATGCLSYFDKVPDGFYVIHGMDPYVWVVCSNRQESGQIPSLQSLKAVNPGIESAIEVILIDRLSDPSFWELQNRIRSIFCNNSTTTEVVDQLAKLTCYKMGGAAAAGEDDLVVLWKECSNDLKKRLGSLALPMGSLSVGLCRHRALLFKVLADTIDLPCRIAKGCKYCRRDDASSCLVHFGDREVLVDLVGNPGCLCEPDSLINGPSSISIFSPLHFPRFRHINSTVDFESLARQFFVDCESLNLVFEDPPTGDGDFGGAQFPHQSDRDNIHTDMAGPRMETANNQRLEGVQLAPSRTTLDVEVFDIPWANMALKEKIGEGSFGTVHRAVWDGFDALLEMVITNLRVEMENLRLGTGSSSVRGEDTPTTQPTEDLDMEDFEVTS